MGISARVLLVATLVLLTAGSASAQKPAKVRRNPDLITNEEAKDPRFRNAYEIVQGLHSNWLTPRQQPSLGTALAKMGQAADSSMAGRAIQQAQAEGPAPMGEYAEVRVYQDGVQLGGVQRLKEIPAMNVYEIRHYVGNDAQTMFGVGHAAGVIVVSTSQGQSQR